MTTTAAIQPLKPHLVFIGGRAMATSWIVADQFGKRHANVLRAIDDACDSERCQRSCFQESTFMDKTGKSRRTVHLSQEGFTAISRSFKGGGYTLLREAYYEAFNTAQWGRTGVSLSTAAAHITVPDRVDVSTLPLLLLLGFGLKRPETVFMLSLLQTATRDEPAIRNQSICKIADECGGLAAKSALYTAVDKLIAAGLIQPLDPGKSPRHFKVDFDALGEVTARGVRLIEELKQMPSVPERAFASFNDRAFGSDIKVLADADRTLRALLADGRRKLH